MCLLLSVLTVFFVDDGKAPCMLIIIDIDDGLFIYTILVTQKNEEKIKKTKKFRLNEDI